MSGEENNNNKRASGEGSSAPHAGEKWRTQSVDDIELGHVKGFVSHDHDAHHTQVHCIINNIEKIA